MMIKELSFVIAGEIINEKDRCKECKGKKLQMKPRYWKFMWTKEWKMAKESPLEGWGRSAGKLSPQMKQSDKTQN